MRETPEFTNKNKTLANNKPELIETLQKNTLEEIKKIFNFEEKETANFERITEQGKSNYVLYIVEQWSKLKLIKDWKESIINLPVDSVIWESTFLQYLKWEEVTNANASVEIQWKYLQISFDNFKKELNSLPREEQGIIISYFRELENMRKGKTKQVHPKS